MTAAVVSEPVPIHRVADRYLLHDADTVSYLRRTHNIIGVLIGGLPQAPQQNVFSGLPVELMPEEALLLVEKKVAYIVDDPSQHTAAFLSNGLSDDEKARFQQLLDRQGEDNAQASNRRAEDRKDSALRKVAEHDADGKKIGNGDMSNWNDLPDGMLAPRPRMGARTKSRRRIGERSASSSVTPGGREEGPPSSGPASSGPPSGPQSISPSAPPSGPPSRARTPVGSSSASIARRDPPPELEHDESDTAKGHPLNDSDRETAAVTDAVEESLFSASAQVPPSANKTTQSFPSITPSTSYPPLRPAVPSTPAPLPTVPVSYPLYAHLHSKGYFLSPGLRFGCRYVAYPGDPLRFHSHFLVDGKAWDEKFDLIDLVAGGRLGTGVKKGFLLGGVEDGKERGKGDGNGDGVRTFTVEWAGM